MVVSPLHTILPEPYILISYAVRSWVDASIVRVPPSAISMVLRSIQLKMAFEISRYLLMAGFHCVYCSLSP